MQYRRILHSLSIRRRLWVQETFIRYLRRLEKNFRARKKDHYVDVMKAFLENAKVSGRATKGCFDVTFSALECFVAITKVSRNTHPLSSRETLRRDDHPEVGPQLEMSF